ncbi:MAG: creatininase family protein [Rubripirellula sp.]
MELSRLTSRDVAQLDRDIPVIVPVAAVEQHAAHLPLATDSLLLGEVLKRARQRSEIRALYLPLMWLGNSHHHLDFQGTLSAESRTWINLLSGTIDNLLFHGFRRIMVVNGHGGNNVPVSQCLFEKRQQTRERTNLLFLNSSYWMLGERPDNGLQWAQSEMGHACEWETSMMLCLDSELVGEFSNLPDISMNSSFPPAERSWVTQERSSDGYIGMPRRATHEKGEALFECFSRGLDDLIRRMHDWDGSSW